jgi:hypothetical protein
VNALGSVLRHSLTIASGYLAGKGYGFTALLLATVAIVWSMTRRA